MIEESKKTKLKMNVFKRGDSATPWVTLVTLIGIVVLFLRFLMTVGAFHSGLLYIAMPYALSLALYYLTPYKEAKTWQRRFWNNIRTFMIVILSSSLILMEGYVCIIMAIPLFILIALLALLTKYLWEKMSRNSLKAYVLPVIVLLGALEGTTSKTTFNRYNEVTYSQVVNVNVDTIRQRLKEPVEFRGKRHWILSIFPMPVYVGTVQLKEGDIRKYDFVYHRWFVTNTKVGSLNVIFKEIDEGRIKTEIQDNSYISGYMKLHGTEFSFEPVDSKRTKVTLTVSFDRTLDPIWYYQPLERFAVKKGIKYFVNEVLGAEEGVDM